MSGPDDRGSLEGPPASMTTPDPAPEAPTPGSPTPQSGSGGFDLNKPTIVSLLYLSSLLLGFTSIVGVVLAYVWRGEPGEGWEASHYQYLINTFWIGLVGGVISVILMIVLIGFLLIMAVAVLVVVRCVLSLINAQKKLPMPNPSTLLA